MVRNMLSRDSTKMLSNNERSNSDNFDSKNCTRYHAVCSFAVLSPEDRVACQENAELLANSGIEFDDELQRDDSESSSQDEQIPSALIPEASSIEEIHLIHFISSIRPRTHNAGNFDTWRSQIPM